MNRTYLDVTSACQSGLNTGVKRMQRGLHTWLKKRPDYFPVYWQSALRDYRSLNDQDYRHLEEPSGPVQGTLLYDAFAPGLFRDWLGAWRERASLLRSLRNLEDGDILLVPDLLWDNRSVFFRRPNAARGQRVGIFHDAIALRQPGQSRIDAYFCARGVRTLSHFDQVICVSREAESDLHVFWKKFGAEPAPTHVIPWPVPFGSERPEGRSNFEARELLCVARLEPHKNHLCLLDACERVWREGVAFKLRLIGCKAYPDAAWKILRRVRELQSAGHDVAWSGYVSEDALHAAYRSASFTVFPSTLEGFGLPIIESLWHGRPVICGANGALGEVAAGGGCETVLTHDPQSLAEGIRRLLLSRPRYEQLYEEARTREFRSWTQYWNDVADALSRTG